MKKIFATLIKEWLLLKRDAAGVMLLLLMPAVLIVVMALIQDAPFRDYQELRFNLLLVDEDGGSLAKEIINGLKKSKNFSVVESLDGKPLKVDQLKDLLQKGTFKVGIVIPHGATAEVANSANLVANNMAKKLGLGSTMPTRESRDSSYVRLFFDPATKPTFRSSISFALDRFVTLSCTNILIQRISRLSKTVSDSTSSDADFKKVFAGVGIKEEVLNENKTDKSHINSVQHNVPAWAIFGMFFIVIPIAGNMIREREDGSAIRIELIPYTARLVSLGRIIFYTLICTLQFWIMMALGLWLMPVLGLPSLYLGIHGWLLLPISLCIAFAATSYGYFTGAFFKTSNQGMPFGAISIVILSALGGLWVPIDLLPAAMKKVALISPLHWSLESVHNIILRDGSFADVWQAMIYLLVFGSTLWLISIYKNISRAKGI
ncbi:MAG: ABC transporter permease [Bacteroidetes bacterium]|nr:ABC transporter permease [Bacteroidota bacterium]MBS1739906.1 ABC transporter permease [Bacteroidota bacterium]